MGRIVDTQAVKSRIGPNGSHRAPVNRPELRLRCQLLDSAKAPLCSKTTLLCPCQQQSVELGHNEDRHKHRTETSANAQAT
jgi:hypothetical protein